MLRLYRLCFFLFFFLLHLNFSSSFQNSSSKLCHHHEMMGLLHFKSEFTINPIFSHYDGYPKTKWWNENIDCCMWDGVTCDRIYSHVIELDLSSSHLGGTMDPNSTLFNLTSLKTLNLAYNDFKSSHISPNFGNFSCLKVLNLSNSNFGGNVPVELGLLSKLVLLDLSYNLLEGPIPSFFSTLPSLNYLHLGFNNFSGKLYGAFPFPFPFGSITTSLEFFSLHGNKLNLDLNIFCKMNNLTYLDLSNNVISMTRGDKYNCSWPKLSYFSLRSCNVSKFPVFSSSKQLETLDLSDNRIQGELPIWLYSVGKNSLTHLNISHNNLTGGFELSSWKSIFTVDVGFNSLQGLLPLPPATASAFLASNNQFRGKMYSFCNLTLKLAYLDLSNNRLSGELPKCLGKFSRGLKVLDLGSNLFQGVISMLFRKNCTLMSLHLDNNSFEGKVPPSIARCKGLQVLNLGINQFNDSFPHRLGSLQELRVLVLKNNNFKGLIDDHLKRYKHPFLKLQILCLSGNKFFGKLPVRYFNNFKALMVNNGGGSSSSSGGNKSLKYFGNFAYYHETLVLTAKGMTLTYKLLTILDALDFSNNCFNGEIPDSIGQLNALLFLNVSNNQLTGHMPGSLANLNSIESLDLSHNKLQGSIPPQLVRLTFLEKFIVSYNQLVGPIPHGSQFSTFSSDSYEGNPGLCGDPLPKCGTINYHSGMTPKSQYDFFDTTRVSLWEIILIGIGFGTIFGFISASCMLYTLRPIWFSRKVEKLEYHMVKRLEKHSRLWESSSNNFHG